MPWSSATARGRLRRRTIAACRRSARAGSTSTGSARGTARSATCRAAGALALPPRRARLDEHVPRAPRAARRASGRSCGTTSWAAGDRSGPRTRAGRSSCSARRWTRCAPSWGWSASTCSARRGAGCSRSSTRSRGRARSRASSSARRSRAPSSGRARCGSCATRCRPRSSPSTTRPTARSAGRARSGTPPTRRSRSGTSTAARWTTPELERMRAGRSPEAYHAMWGPNEWTATGELAGWDVRDRLGELDVPTLVIRGAYDLSTEPVVADARRRHPRRATGGLRGELARARDRGDRALPRGGGRFHA